MEAGVARLGEERTLLVEVVLGPPRQRAGLLVDVPTVGPLRVREDLGRPVRGIARRRQHREPTAVDLRHGRGDALPQRPRASCLRPLARPRPRSRARATGPTRRRRRRRGPGGSPLTRPPSPGAARPSPARRGRTCGGRSRRGRRGGAPPGPRPPRARSSDSPLARRSTTTRATRPPGPRSCRPLGAS